MNVVPVLRDEAAQQSVPTVWRDTIRLIVNALLEGDYSLDRGIAGVHQIPEDKAVRIAQNISSYGAVLKGLPDESWD